MGRGPLQDRPRRRTLRTDARAGHRCHVEPRSERCRDCDSGFAVACWIQCTDGVRLDPDN